LIYETGCEAGRGNAAAEVNVEMIEGVATDPGADKLVEQWQVPRKAFT